MNESEGKELPSELPPVLCHDTACLNIYEQLAYKIKFVLVCSVKGDPACYINMPLNNTDFKWIDNNSVTLSLLLLFL